MVDTNLRMPNDVATSKLPQSAADLEQVGRPGFIALGLGLAAVYYVLMEALVPPMVGRELLYLPILGLVLFSFFHTLYVVRARLRKR